MGIVLNVVYIGLVAKFVFHVWNVSRHVFGQIRLIQDINQSIEMCNSSHTQTELARTLLGPERFATVIAQQAEA
jgi:hypothetical protein